MRLKASCIAVAVVLLGALPSYAQLPRVFEGLQNPHVVFGVSYLTDNPGPDQQRWNSFLTANVPLLKLGDLPCAALGIGLTGADLGPPYDQFEWGASIPILTCSLGNDSQFAFQGGWTVAFVGDTRPTGYYAGIGFSLTDSDQLAEKRARRKAEKEAKRAAELARAAPTGR
jgi:hypothetical protein